MERIFIVGAKRTPIGKFGGGLASVSASDLGATAIRAVVEQANIDPKQVDQVLMGNVIQAGQGQNPARQATLKAGLPVSVPAITINDVCGSGLSSINMAASLIQTGQAQVIVAGGMESMSKAPFVLEKNRFNKDDHTVIEKDAMQTDALIDAAGQYSMGITAENVAEKYDITRSAMDHFAKESHEKAVRAQQQGLFDNEIVPVMTTDSAGQSKMIMIDEGPRANSTFEKLSTLKAAFKEDGMVTAGNASGLNDGAAAVLLMNESKMLELGITPLAEWQGAATVGLEPALMGIGPYYAIEELMTRNSELTLDDIDLFELNEAFAAQALASNQLLGINPEQVNINGGALALGHPVGASGSRILVTLIYNLIREKTKTGVAALCVGGGMGVAALIQAHQE